MNRFLPIILVVVTVILLGIGLTGKNRAATTGAAQGSALAGFTSKPATPEQALANFLLDVQKHNWDRAFSSVERTSEGLNEQAFIQEWRGTDGGLRSYSTLESYDARPLHATDTEAQMRVRLHWSTPVGPIEDVRDFRLARGGEMWKVIWDQVPPPNVPAQVIPVNYLQWDLVTGSAADEWGAHNVDSPNVRIISMNAVDSSEGAVVIGEVVNEDTIPAFVNVNAILLDGSGNQIDDENSFDKIDHVLLPKQVSPYRIDFPKISLSKVKNVRMDVKATLVPASSDPVIGVMNQKITTDPQGRSVLQGDLFNESGKIVNIPHVIASFYDTNGKVVWVADGYVERALSPQTSESFAVEIPKSVAGKVHNFHVVVNQYSTENS